MNKEITLVSLKEASVILIPLFNIGLMTIWLARSFGKSYGLTRGCPYELSKRNSSFKVKFFKEQKGLLYEENEHEQNYSIQESIWLSFRWSDG